MTIISKFRVNWIQGVLNKIYLILLQKICFQKIIQKNKRIVRSVNFGCLFLIVCWSSSIVQWTIKKIQRKMCELLYTSSIMFLSLFLTNKDIGEAILIRRERIEIILHSKTQSCYFLQVFSQIDKWIYGTSWIGF